MASALFSRLHHVCIVVPDIDAAQQYYEYLGVGPWQPFPPLSSFEVSIPAADFQSLTYRYADLDGVQIQLCEPGDGDTPQRTFLEQSGPGVFHLGFAVPNVDDAEATGAALGLEVLLRGRRPDDSGFTYFDTPSAGSPSRSAPPPHQSPRSKTGPESGPTRVDLGSERPVGGRYPRVRKAYQRRRPLARWTVTVVQRCDPAAHRAALVDRPGHPPAAHSTSEPLAAYIEDDGGQVWADIGGRRADPVGVNSVAPGRTARKE
jgi:methylmalonyl-CoA/ethylmalonyl-CoA epimerase